MDDILRWAASVGTIGAGLILAARVRPRITGWAFVVLSGASIIWIVVGYLTAEYALMVQNVVVTLINVFGIYRWLRGRYEKPGARRSGGPCLAIEKI
jgi:nicotinamide riboside transporter PnuC